MREEILKGIGSLLALTRTYEVLALLLGRGDLLVYTDRAKEGLVSLQALMQKERPFEQRTLQDVVRALEDFERHLYDRDDAIPVSKPVIRYL
jgi:hypothetical protein